MQNETKFIRFFKTLSTRVFWNKKWVFEKKIKILSKKHRGSKFAVECDEIGKFSQKVWKSWAVLEKRWVFRKTIDASETAEGSKFVVKSNWNSKISRNLQNFGWYTKIKKVLQKKTEFSL